MGRQQLVHCDQKLMANGALVSTAALQPVNCTLVPSAIARYPKSWSLASYDNCTVTWWGKKLLNFHDSACSGASDPGLIGDAL